jgi:hypothetical protein
MTKKNDNSSFTYIVNKKEKPHKFYSVCVDNFFEKPDLLRNFGLNLPKKPCSTGDWPGERSQELHTIDSELTNSILLKILSSYFDFRYDNIQWSESSVTFQQIKKYSDNKDNIKNIGWIHQDFNFDLAGLIYLTPNIDTNCGTSLFNLKESEKNTFILNARLSHKHLLFQNKDVNDEQYSEAHSKWNNKFVEKTKFQNIYNRMISYDTQEFHRANNFFNDGDDRLTLVYFLKDIKVSKTPLNRVKDNESYDNFISERINENFKS